MSREFKNKVREQFGRAADGYIHDRGFATGDDLEMMVLLLQPMPDDNMLDVACGGGHTALRFSPLVRSVVASDLTMVMLKKAQEFISEEGGVDNVTFREADAEDLPRAQVDDEHHGGDLDRVGHHGERRDPPART